MSDSLFPQRAPTRMINTSSAERGPGLNVRVTEDVLQCRAETKRRSRTSQRHEQHRDVAPGTCRCGRGQIGIGERRRRSICTNDASATTARRTSRRSARGRHPVGVRLDQAVGQAKDASAEVASPGGRGFTCVSSRLVDQEEAGGDGDGADRDVDEEVQCQLSCSVRRPPTSGPIASASGGGAAQIPIARSRAPSGGRSQR